MDIDANFSIDDDDDQMLSTLELDKIIELDKRKSELAVFDKHDSTVKVQKLSAVGSSRNRFETPKYDGCPIPIRSAFSGQRFTSQLAMPPPAQPVIPAKNIAKEKWMEGDGDWKKFLKWVDSQKIFNTPWCKAVPITALNVSQCKTLVSRMKDEHEIELIKFGSIIFASLKEIRHLSDESTDYYQELIHILMITFTRIEEISKLGKLRPPRNEELHELSQEILQTCMTGKMDSSVVNIIIRLYPHELINILRSSLQVGNPKSLLPLCYNQENFTKILNLLHDNYNDSIKSDSTLFDEDQDFQPVISRAIVAEFSRKLVKALRKSLTCQNFINIFPTRLQPLVSIYVLILQNPMYFEDEQIGNEMLVLLNDLLVKCNDCGFGETFVYFFILILPICLRMLSEKWSNKLIKFKDFPYLWQFAKEYL